MVNRLTSFLASNHAEDSLMQKRCASSFVLGVCCEICECDLPRSNPNRCSTVTSKYVFRLLWREYSSGTTMKNFVRRSFCKPSHVSIFGRSLVTDDPTKKKKKHTHHHAQLPLNSIRICSLFSSLHIPMYLPKETMYQVPVCPVWRQIQVTHQHRLFVRDSRPLTFPNESSKTCPVRANFNISVSFRYSKTTQKF